MIANNTCTIAQRRNFAIATVNEALHVVYLGSAVEAT